MRIAISQLFLLLAACSSSGQVAPDGGVVGAIDARAPDGGVPLTKPFVDFSIAETHFEGFAWESDFPSNVVEQSRIGGCVFASFAPRFCDPGCSSGMICIEGNVCARSPDSLGIGSVAVTGTTPTLDVTPTEQNYYVSDVHPGLLPEGVEAVLSGDGAGEILPFELRTRGVAQLTLPTTQLVANEHQDMTIFWNAANNVDAEVVVHFDSDHHGLAAYLECTGPDSGEMTIPSEIVDALIEVGETGIGTFIENSWIQRRSRELLDRDDALFVFSAVSFTGLQVETIRAP